MCWSCSVLELLCAGVAVCRSCGVQKLQCVGVLVCRICGVWELVCGSCGVCSSARIEWKKFCWVMNDSYSFEARIYMTCTHF